MLDMDYGMRYNTPGSYHDEYLNGNKWDKNEMSPFFVVVRLFQKGSTRVEKRAADNMLVVDNSRRTDGSWARPSPWEAMQAERELRRYVHREPIMAG